MVRFLYILSFISVTYVNAESDISTNLQELNVESNDYPPVSFSEVEMATLSEWDQSYPVENLNDSPFIENTLISSQNVELESDGDPSLKQPVVPSNKLGKPQANNEEFGDEDAPIPNEEDYKIPASPGTPEEEI